jgi:phenylacetate-coenzyme A ligase PaaK-like adenylate-forming protein
MVEPETSSPDSAILVTKLRADGMPMLRYRIGDRGRFPPDSRPGVPSFTLLEVLGRETHRIWLPGGAWVDGIQFPHLMKDHPVTDFQVTQTRDKRVVVEVVPDPRFTAADELRILETLKANLTGVEVVLRRVSSVARPESSKWEPVRSDASPAERGPR